MIQNTETNIVINTVTNTNESTNTVTKEFVTVLAVAAAHQNFKRTKRRFPPVALGATEACLLQLLHY